ncbi:sigma intracellular receptor 2 [Neltuma alba]|uniref:sigma intracellular receptor 2-like n=1 Tax=Neltuma alba TaxID=207710 RepID=UPI0010A3E885|nr:sigma intracellular receptor 2-like [Prosopis alba]XP_028808441.1 sigma intracellular receptor 2-like [Prosopis alba]
MQGHVFGHTFPSGTPNVPFRICILPKQYKEWPENRTAFFSREMGFAVKVIDAVIFLFLLVIALAAPLLDAQTFIPHTYYPGFLVQLKNWYSREYGDYLVIDKPPFFVGLVCFELIFQWPLVLLNLYAILTSKPWLNTTCLIYGVSLSTSMVVILSDMVGSGRASAKLLILYCPFMAFGVLATLRGLLSHSTGTYSSVGKRPAVPRKKRA